MDAHWRDSARPVRFFFIDGKAAFPLVLFLLHIRLWTFIIALTCSIFFTVLSHFGFSPIVFLRWLRNFIAGDRKAAYPSWMK
ncbi:MAG: phosphoesterase [Gammaproteobacteria bacterium GWE2_42_36]|nr:MAG: phosphoesterase [Gammaproteobacteria bacterium GWE2_42_36]HCU04768.1 phosphoesterase [Coxiellaceae bacterium]